MQKGLGQLVPICPYRQIYIPFQKDKTRGNNYEKSRNYADKALLYSTLRRLRQDKLQGECCNSDRRHGRTGKFPNGPCMGQAGELFPERNSATEGRTLFLFR